MKLNIQTEKNRNIVVLLTATIDVKNVSLTKRQDINLRLSDYESSLEFWIKNKDVDNLVFIENSGFDLTSLIEKCKSFNANNKKVEFISYNDNFYSRELGKGYGEMRNIEYAINNSKLINANTLVVKVTGRYIIKNIGKILQEMKNRQISDVYCDFNHNLKWANCLIFSSTVDFMTKYLIPKKEMINDSKGVYFEHIFSNAIHECLAKNGIWSMFPCKMNIIGISGTSNSTLTRNILYSLKDYLNFKIRYHIYSH